jgi:hypothetical protein
MVLEERKAESRACISLHSSKNPPWVVSGLRGCKLQLVPEGRVP